MYKKLLFTFVLIFGSLITIYPSKKEDTNLFDYCYSFEKILSRNSIEKSKNLSKKFKPFAKDITLFGTNKTKGSLVFIEGDATPIGQNVSQIFSSLLSSSTSN